MFGQVDPDMPLLTRQNHVALDERRKEHRVDTRADGLHPTEFLRLLEERLRDRPEDDLRVVSLLAARDETQQPRRLTERDDENTGRIGVERSAVTSPSLADFSSGTILAPASASEASV